MVARFPFRLAALMLAGLIVAAVLALASLVPVYTDEIGWRFQERFWIDGVDRPIFPNCGINTLTVPPWFMVPVRAFSGVINLSWSDPLAVRLAGLGCAALWFALLWRLVAVTVERERRPALFLGAVSLTALGVLPLMLAMSRPEQPLLLCLTAALVLVMAARHRQLGPIAVAWRCAAIVLLALVALSYHLKGVIYAPLFLASLLLVDRSRRSLAIRLAAAALLAAASIAAARYWSARFLCPGDSILAAAFARDNVAFLLASDRSLGSIGQLLISNANLLDYVKLTLPAGGHMSDWLPPDIVDRDAVRPWIMAIKLVWIFAILALLALVAIGAARLVERRGRDARGVVLAALLTMTAFGWAALQINKNAYEAALLLPVLVMALVLAVGQVEPSGRSRLAYGWVVTTIAGVAVASLALLSATYGPALADRARQPGYSAGQPFSISPYGYARLQPLVERAAARCAIRRGSPLTGLLVDDVSYFTFADSYRPYYRLGLLEVWNGSIDRPARYLLDHGSSGVVLRCSVLPAAMRSAALATEPLCCLDRERLVAAARAEAGLSYPRPTR